MPDTPTPGQLAYEACAAFWRGYGFGPQTHVAWRALTPEQRGAWEAAAEAVLEAWVQAQTRLDSPAWLIAMPPPHEQEPQP